MMRCGFFCFFFSSRRRHTRCSRDWSSDVCSSDLASEGSAFVVASSEGLASATARPNENGEACQSSQRPARRDRKSTRLNSSHGYISYAVFCLKKKKKKKTKRSSNKKRNCNTGV